MAKKKTLTNADNVYTGTAGSDWVLGMGGNDQLSGGAGNDKLFGGKGNDLLRGGAGDDILNGGAGNDNLVGGDGDDTIDAKIGNDSVTGGAGDDVVKLSGNYADATISVVTGGFKIVTAAGTTIVKSVEFFQFADQTVSADDLGGKSLDLTVGIDKALGGIGDDMINGSSLTYTSLDNIDGGDGNDTLTIVDAKGATTVVANATVVGVENVTVTNGDGGTVIVDVQTWVGLDAINISQTGGFDDIIVDTKSNATSITIAGGAFIDVADNGATGKDTLASVSISNSANSGITVASDALTTFSVNNAVLGTFANIIAAAGTRTLTAEIASSDFFGLFDATATAVDVTASGSTENFLIDAASATSVTLNSDGDVDVSLFAALATSIDINGAGKFTADVASFVAADAVIDATGNTGGVDITNAALLTGQNFKGGTGADSIDLTDNKTANTLGAGDDTLVLQAVLATGGSVDGGDGNDTLSMAAANAATVSANIDFAASISSFELVKIQGADGDTIDMAGLDSISAVEFDGVGKAGLILTGVAANSTITFTGDVLGATSIALASDTGKTDVVNLAFTAADGVDSSGGITVAGVETINITTDDNLGPAATTQTLLDLIAVDAKTINISGDVGVSFISNLDAITLDASGLTGTGVSGGVSATANYTKGVSFTGGAGNDSLTGNIGNDTLIGNGGDDGLYGNDGNDTLSGGKGDDTLAGGNGLDSLMGGDGKDVFIFNAAAESQGVTVDVVSDFVSGADSLTFDVSPLAGTATYVGEANGYGAVLTALTGGTTVSAVLDTSSNILYVDANGDGALNSSDYAVKLTGISDLTNGIALGSHQDVLFI